MGTRADFYVDQEWLGSIAWDGHVDTVLDILGLGEAKDEADWRTRVAKMLAERDDGTKPDDGWPWPWDDSSTTDYAYSFHDGKVWWTYGDRWCHTGSRVRFPNMKKNANVTLGARSGVLLMGAK